MKTGSGNCRICVLVFSVYFPESVSNYQTSWKKAKLAQIKKFWLKSLNFRNFLRLVFVLHQQDQMVRSSNHHFNRQPHKILRVLWIKHSKENLKDRVSDIIFLHYHTRSYERVRKNRCLFQLRRCMHYACILYSNCNDPPSEMLFA